MAIAPQNNPPITPWYYKPRAAFIASIVQGQTTTINTVHDQYYVVGQVVRVILGVSNGCRGLSNNEYIVIQVPSTTQVIIAVDSTQETPFALYTSNTQPQIVPTGDFNSGQINSQGRVNNASYIPGSFQNISPLGNVIWH